MYTNIDGLIEMVGSCIMDLHCIDHNLPEDIDKELKEHLKQVIDQMSDVLLIEHKDVKKTLVGVLCLKDDVRNLTKVRALHGRESNDYYEKIDEIMQGITKL